MNKRPLPGEFELIERFFAPLAKDFPGALALKDDAAVIEIAPGHRLVATTDALVAGVHYLVDDPPALVARKLLRVNLSDIAAMGAKACAYLLALALPKDTDAAWLEGFADGLRADAREFECPLAGGDTVVTDGPATLALSALGQVPEGGELRRSTAKVGDRIFVSGSIGDGALGLKALNGELGILAQRHRDYTIERYRLPRPRLALGQRLVGLAHAAIDISDGLIADLGHVCETSGVGAEIQSALLPKSDAARIALADDPGLLSALMTGGDDYELLFTVAPEASVTVAGLARDLDLPLTAIGFITGKDGVDVTDAEAAGIVLDSPGFRHF